MRRKQKPLPPPPIDLVVAMTSDYVIGFSNKLPWRLSADLRRFRKLTIGQVVVMGRRTFESIGRPLPRRTNVVVSRKRRLRIEGCVVLRSLDAVLDRYRRVKKIVVIGGGQLYREALPLSSRIYLTVIEFDRQTRQQPFLFDQPIGGDAFFPELNPGDWKISSLGKRRVARPKGAGLSIDEGEYPSAIYFRFLILQRRKAPSLLSQYSQHFASAFDLPKDMPQQRKTQKRKVGAKRTSRRSLSQPDLFQ